MKLSQLNSKEEKARRVLYKFGGYDFHRMKLYLGDMQNLFTRQKENIKKRHTAEIERYPASSWQLIDEVYEAHYRNYDIDFVGILLNSSFISAYSLFEVIFKQVCVYAAKKRRVEINVNEFSGSDVIGKCKMFIERNVGIDLSPLNEHWSNLMTHRKLRNSITHDSATIKPNNQFLEAYARSNEYIQIRRPRSKKATNFFIKHHYYVVEFLDLSRDYLLWMLMELEKKQKPVVKTNLND
jgi:hypothetical protein